MPEEPTIEETGSSGLSRRTVLKGAVIASRAAAGSPPPGTCTAFVCGNGPCNTNCSNPVDTNAYCFQRADGLPGICAPNFFCNNPSCTDNSDCGPGEACFINTCCGPGGVCAPLDCESRATSQVVAHAKGGRSAGVPA